MLSTLSKLSESKCIRAHYAARNRRLARRLAALTSSPRRSSASALSGSALRITFSRYALSEKAGRSARLLVAVRLIWHVKSSGLYMPNHALKELEMRYAISSSVKAPIQVDSPLCTQLVKWEIEVIKQK